MYVSHTYEFARDLSNSPLQVPTRWLLYKMIFFGLSGVKNVIISWSARSSFVREHQSAG